MDLYTASKYDLHEKLHTDDREAEARYLWERQHKCKRDRIATVATIKQEDGRLAPDFKKIPCCLECFLAYYQHEVPNITLEQAEVIDLHPNQAA